MISNPDAGAVVLSLCRPGSGVTTLSELEHRQAAEVLGDGPLDWATWVSDLVAMRMGEDPVDSLAPVAEIRQATERGLIHLLVALVTGGGVIGPASLYLQDSILHDIVTRDIPMDQVVATMRLIQDVWINVFIDEALERSAPSDTVTELMRAVTSTWDKWVDTYIHAHLRLAQHVTDTTVGRSRAVIESLIDGYPVEPESALALLGLRLELTHVAVVIGARPRARISERELNEYLARITRVWRVSDLIRYPTTNGQLRAWASFEPGRGLKTLSALPQPPLATFVGVGSPCGGSEGFRRSFVEADEAFRVALFLQGQQVLAYRDVELMAVLTRDMERARWFVDRELGDLVGDSDEMRDLRTTLTTFFAERMRAAPTAERLYIHRNTLNRRLSKIEDLLGHSVAERVAELDCALKLYRLTRQTLV